MRLSGSRWLMVLGAVLAASAAPARAVDHSAPTCAGDWEAVIASPERPWIFQVRLTQSGAAWSGLMSVEGIGDFPLREVRADSSRVRFALPPELDSLVFEGTLSRDEIVGSVSRAGRTIPTRLERVIPPPAAASRLQAWQQDLDFAGGRLSEYDRSFTPEAWKAFQQELARLKNDLPHRDDAEILVALSRAVALAGNAHTRLRLDPTRQGTFSTEFPIRIWWFRDGPYVVKAAPAYQRLLRCRVISIGGHEVSEARAQVVELFAGNAAWDDYLSPLYLTSPDVLYGLGLIPSRDHAAFVFEDSAGTRFEVSVRAGQIDRSAMADESWQELSPLTVTGRPPWTPALPTVADSLPLYLRHPRQPYWFEFLPGSGLLYFQYNRAAEADPGPSFEEFGDSLLAFAERHPPRAVVVDLRLNSGGDLGIAKAFMKGLGANPTINRRGRLFVIIGHCTFSAGLFHAAQLRQFTQATFVGEPVGDRLEFWAEGGRIVLPHSHAALGFSNGFHGYSGVDHPEYRPYYEELSVPNLDPDVAVPTTSQDYFAGRDPALEAIEARVPR